ncbi:MAG: serine dehydratase beta chain, partial [Salegentibacter sp.]
MRKIECISVFDMLKVGVGPSSSHTLGPWRAAQRWIGELKKKGIFDLVQSIHVDLYGSLSLTGRGHATDIATILGLCGHDPVTIDIEIIGQEIEAIRQNKKLFFNGEKEIVFD